MCVNNNISTVVKVPSFTTILIFIVLLFTGISVNAQGNGNGGGNGGGFNGGGNGKIPCRDSTPICPCVLPNGDCFDIDTPIDDDLKILILAGAIIGVIKLNSIRKLQLNR